ncbi:MAG: hypothetical protein IJB83_03270 [Bacilli bacterium]|nr:hypothetical protein [Bacilli bacterium]
MCEDIAKIIFDYSINNKMADEEFVNKIIKIIIHEKSLYNYIKELTIITSEEKNEFNYNSFNFSSGKLIINLNKDLRKNKLSFINNKILLHNISIALTILHELDHTLLRKEVDLDKDTLSVLFMNIINDIKKPKLVTLTDFEKEALSKEEIKTLENECMTLTLKMYKKIIYYELFHNKAPHERRANINSHLTLSEVFKYLYNTSISDNDLDSIRLYQLKCFINNCRYKYKITHYGITNSPSYDYIRSIESENKLSMITIYDKDNIIAYNNAKKIYTMQERILYGLPLNENELKKINLYSNPFNAYRKKLKQ